MPVVAVTGEPAGGSEGCHEAEEEETFQAWLFQGSPEAADRY